MVLGQLDRHMQKNEVGSLPQTILKINLKWITDLNVRARSIKFLEENVEINLCDLGPCSIRHDTMKFDMEPKAQVSKNK